MCEYCQSATYEHLIGCPNAPEPEPLASCRFCGEELYAWHECYLAGEMLFCKGCVTEGYVDEFL